MNVVKKVFVSTLFDIVDGEYDKWYLTRFTKMNNRSQIPLGNYILINKGKKKNTHLTDPLYHIQPVPMCHRLDPLRFRSQERILRKRQNPMLSWLLSIVTCVRRRPFRGGGRDRSSGRPLLFVRGHLNTHLWPEHLLFEVFREKRIMKRAGKGSHVHWEFVILARLRSDATVEVNGGRKSTRRTPAIRKSIRIIRLVEIRIPQVSNGVSGEPATDLVTKTKAPTSTGSTRLSLSTLTLSLLRPPCPENRPRSFESPPPPTPKER